MKKIGFIGAGNMATAIIGSLMGQNDGKADFINVFDLDKEKCDIMSKKGINIKNPPLMLCLKATLPFSLLSRRIIPKCLRH